jgi:hypothetical protein
MQPRWLAAVAVSVVAISIGAGSASATSCIRSEERMAFEVRAMQTELMVAALSCNVQQDYNTFVTRFKSVLNKHVNTMNGYFKRVFGPSGEREITRYTTGLANRSALTSVADMNKFCDESIATLRAAHSVPLKDFDSFTMARKIALAPDLGPAKNAAVCTVSSAKPIS